MNPKFQTDCNTGSLWKSGGKKKNTQCSNAPEVHKKNWKHKTSCFYIFVDHWTGTRAHTSAHFIDGLVCIDHMCGSIRRVFEHKYSFIIKLYYIKHTVVRQTVLEPIDVKLAIYMYICDNSIIFNLYIQYSRWRGFSLRFRLLSVHKRQHSPNSFKYLWEYGLRSFRLRFFLSHLFIHSTGQRSSLHTYQVKATIVFPCSCTAWATSLPTHLTEHLKLEVIWITVLIVSHTVCFISLNVTVRIEFMFAARIDIFASKCFVGFSV